VNERLQQSDGKVITFESNEFNSMQSSPSPLKKANNTSSKKNMRPLENVEEEKHEDNYQTENDVDCDENAKANAPMRVEIN